MHLEQAKSEVDFEHYMITAPKTLKVNQEDLMSGMRFMKGLIIGSILSLPCWILVLWVVL
jgi:hypothetical protein